MFRLRTLGGAALLRDGTPLDSVGAQRKLMALLALLAGARQRGISRERLASYLWPESDEDRSRGALKQLLHVLRRQMGTPDVVIGGAEIRLNPQCIESDLEEFLAAVESGEHHRAVDRYGGAFLDGFNLPSAPQFEEWVRAQESALARHYADSLATLALAAMAQSAYAEAAALWRRLQSHDRYSARAVTGLMEALDALGERAGALRAANTYQTLIREEFGAAPDQSVTALAERLRTAPATGGPAAAAAPTQIGGAAAGPPESRTEAADHPVRDRPRSTRWRAALLAVLALLAVTSVFLLRREDGSGRSASAPEASIAVLPFVNNGDSAADAHFSDGLTDELISRLGKVEGLRVAARTSTFALKGKGLSAHAIADTLGVATLLEGSVRRMGDRLKITAQLVDAGANVVLWSEAYDRRMEDVFAVQDEIALAIATALQRALPLSVTARAETLRPTSDLEAYDLYLRGRYDWQLPPRARLQQATIHYRRAIERDPGFALAHAGLAEAYVNQAVYNYMPAGEALARAKVSSEQALALDPNLVEALAAHSYVLMSELEFSAAEADLRRAVALNPSSSWVHHFLTLLLMMMGRPEEAIPHNRQALKLDPLSLPANATRGILDAQLGRDSSAVAELTRARMIAPDFTLTLYYLGAVQAAQGRNEAALETLTAASRQAPDYPGLPGALALVQKRLGRAAIADSILASLEKRRGDRRAQTNLAFAHAMAGRNEEAFRMLERTQWDIPALIGLRADPLLTGLRADPQYAKLLKSVGAQP